MKLLRLLAVVGLALAGTTVSPAWACGCGGYVPDAASQARVYGENALVRFDGRTEQIHLSMAVDGRSRTAAWIMPVPSAATVELGRENLFAELDRRTRPRIEYRITHHPSWTWPSIMAGRGDGAGAPPPASIDIRAIMRLGPFEVVRLTGTDPAKVTTWLTGHGYAARPGLAGTLKPYVDEHWEIVAVRLAPESDLDGLTGATPPLKLTFASGEIVYPMRMSRGATTSQTVTVYVAAPYKVVPQATPDPSVEPALLYAGPAEGAGELAAPASYLTAYTATYTTPQRISSDFRFGRAPDNEPYQLVQVVTRNEPFWANVAILAGGHVLLLALAIGLAVLLRRREQASH
jgi:hypothetical protein